MARRSSLGGTIGIWLAFAAASAAAERDRRPLDPAGEIHVPIGIANSLDTLKTFVEAEGVFSPGVGTYGIYFWLYHHDRRALFAPTAEGAACEHGLPPTGALVPWSRWRAGDVTVTSEACEVKRPSPAGDIHVVGARVRLDAAGDEPRRVSLYAALRPLGPAGFDVKEIATSDALDALLVEGRPALVADRRASAAGVVAADTIGDFASRGELPVDGARSAASPGGDASGALRFDLAFEPGKPAALGFVCPVLPGRRAAGHRWDGVNAWAQLDLARPNPASGGILQPDPGLAYYRSFSVNALFGEAEAYWRDLAGRVTFSMPDPLWSQAFAAIVGHAALAMNDGAPDVAVVNYNVFNRDGVYVVNILQKADRFDLAAAGIDYFLAHPFNGRSYPEADNPGQILWIMGEHWRFTRDRAWLERVWPAARKLAALIRYYRTTPEPHWVQMDAIEFGDAVPAAQRRKLDPGRCDGHNPAYTEAFDLAGIGACAVLADAVGAGDEAREFRAFAETLFAAYDRTYGGKLPAGYGSYCVLWPCRLYPFGAGNAFDEFKGIGKQSPSDWRYFALARAHQGLLAGNREAGFATIEEHLAHPQMRSWFAFDEGGKSGAGGWGHLRTTWDGSVAMPHGWAIAETFLLLRDCVAFEDGDRLVLLAGVPASWFTGTREMRVANLPTHFGRLDLSLRPVAGGRQPGAELALGGSARPPAGFVLRLPARLLPAVTIGGTSVPPAAAADFVVPPAERSVRIQFTGGVGP